MINIHSKQILIRGGRVVDPATNTDQIADVLLQNGRIEAVTNPNSISEHGDYQTVIDAAGKIVCPGFIDLHTHIRTPGEEWKEDIKTGSAAAARGGFTTICAMPNTYPAQDNAAVIKSVLEKSAQEASVRVRLIGAITQARHGKTLAPMHEMADSGAIGFSDDGDPVMSSHIMLQALKYSSSLELPVINHAEDRHLATRWDMNDGYAANRLGLHGLPTIAESLMVSRDIELLRISGGRLHVPHVSTAASVKAIQQAKEDGLNITAEATPHHIAITENWVFGEQGNIPNTLSEASYDTNAKMAPPLRSEQDRQALAQAVEQGVIDAIATDHAPHAKTEKMCTFAEAANGIIGLETAFSMLMWHTEIDLKVVIKRLTEGPRSILRDDKIGCLKRGAYADLAIIDPDAEWRVDRATLGSKSENTPLIGTNLKWRVIRTLVGGETVWDTSLESNNAD